MMGLLTLIAALALSPGCLVLSLNPAFDGDTIAWEPGPMFGAPAVFTRSAAVDRPEGRGN